MRQRLLECCVDSVESALAAAEGGADRLELCAALIIGGISPGLALFEQVRECCDLPVRVLLRPRSGDFFIRRMNSGFCRGRQNYSGKRVRKELWLAA